MFRPRTIGILLLGATALAAVACGGTVGRGTPSPGSRVTATALSTPIPSGSPAPTATAGTLPSPTPRTSSPTLTPRAILPTATPKPPPVTDPAATVSTELTLDIFGIGEETTVKGSSIIVAGRTRADAVLSINGVIIPMDDEGRFEVTVALNPGPNLIEVVASDLEGNQKSRVLAVVALPEVF